MHHADKEFCTAAENAKKKEKRKKKKKEKIRKKVPRNISGSREPSESRFADSSGHNKAKSVCWSTALISVEVCELFCFYYCVWK